MKRLSKCERVNEVFIRIGKSKEKGYQNGRVEWRERVGGEVIKMGKSR